ncbi:hypothetical protein TcasGA2_TC031851 [Tribolium castaneum]|uniref:Uncharacterized protein n=1 Tax=Tribolium castaneum TaxID=7070 RepID=A0A139W9B2_TRICA|nr:hypothetical protein TcasGA2_TC031851 [Tribolium castaneum]
MHQFTSFLNEQSVKNVLYLYHAGFFKTPEMLRDAFNYINIKIVFNNYSLEAWEQVSYDQMSNQVNNMGQMCNNFSDEIAHGIRNLTDDNVNNKCDDESWYMENFNFPNDVQSTMSKTTMKRALNQPSTSRFDEFTNLQPSTSKATESVNALKRRLPNFEDGPLDTLVNQIGAGQIDDNEVFENFADEFNFINKNGENESFIKKFNTLARRMRFSFKDNAPENPIEWMQNAIEELLAHIFRGFSSDDYVGLVLENEEFPERPVYISFRKLSQYNVAMVMETVGNVLQSNRWLYLWEKDFVPPPMD